MGGLREGRLGSGERGKVKEESERELARDRRMGNRWRGGRMPSRAG